jgi:hypothetical protein
MKRPAQGPGSCQEGWSPKTESGLQACYGKSPGNGAFSMDPIRRRLVRLGPGRAGCGHHGTARRGRPTCPRGTCRLRAAPRAGCWQWSMRHQQNGGRPTHARARPSTSHWPCVHQLVCAPGNRLIGKVAASLEHRGCYLEHRGCYGAAHLRRISQLSSGSEHCGRSAVAAAVLFLISELPGERLGPLCALWTDPLLSTSSSSVDGRRLRRWFLFCSR